MPDASLTVAPAGVRRPLTLRRMLWRSRLRCTALALTPFVAISWFLPLGEAPPLELVAPALGAAMVASVPVVLGARWRRALGRTATAPPGPVYLEPLRRAGSDESVRALAVRLEPSSEPVGWFELAAGQDTTTLCSGLAFAQGRLQRGEPVVVSRSDGRPLFPASGLHGRTWAKLNLLRPAPTPTLRQGPGGPVVVRAYR